MGTLVSVDLGKRVSGLAVWHDAQLAFATEVRVSGRSPTPLAMAAALLARAPNDGVWVAERMLDYAGRSARARDLEHLREVVRALRLSVQVREFAAHRWKGAVPKHVCWQRALAILSESEAQRVDPVTKETTDAVAMGLVALGRATRGVIPNSGGEK